MAVSSAALDIDSVVKRYGDRVALDGVSLRVEAGEVCGLLGPNGAGKTTLVSIVAGLRNADSGRVSVAGVDMATGGRSARAQVGLAAQETGIYPTVTVRDNLVLFADLAGYRNPERDRRVDEVAEILELTEFLARLARHLSGGEKRRLHTAMALLHRPRVLLLDEPTTGVDVSTRGRLLAAVTALAARDETAVVYSTHYLPEIEELGASVAILDRGKFLARGSLDDLIAAHGSGGLEVNFDGDAPSLSGHALEVDGSTLRLTTERPGIAMADIIGQLGRDADRVVSVDVKRPSLESVFLALTGRRYSADDVDVADDADDDRDTVTDREEER
ncbi:MAG: type transport system ATP-binding protein [Actinomycetota bacterium]|nr:type transport system ATP-binding protein [Actinomycetota bacterium]MDQ1478552.1 type transport system ATP-binding protein [Actinomycetota bacterium]